MRNDFLRLGLLKEEFLLSPDVMEDLYKIFNTSEPVFATAQKIASNSVTYEIVENVAVISVDGAMYKKDMSGMCMSVASYQEIMSFTTKAEADTNVAKILYRVTTVGGTAAGIDPLEEMIANCTKETAVIFEDVGASAGIYAFSACDKMFATEMTEVGSIGVVSGFMKKGGADEVEYITSSRAKNKVTDLSTTAGKAKYLKKLDKREEKFYSVVQKNTGFTAEKIEKVFDNGDTIFAQEATDEGFLQGVTTFQLLLDSMVSGETLGVNPDLEQVKASASNQNLKQGESMSEQTYTKESFEALENTHAEALKGVNTQLTTLDEALVKMTAIADDATEKLTSLTKTVDEKEKATPEIMAMAFSKGVNEETLTNMAMSNTLKDAKVAMVDGMSSDGAFGANVDDKNTNAKAEDNKEEFQAKCDKLGVVIVQS